MKNTISKIYYFSNSRLSMYVTQHQAVIGFINENSIDINLLCRTGMTTN